jgi:hypothetical protein
MCWTSFHDEALAKVQTLAVRSDAGFPQSNIALLSRIRNPARRFYLESS